MIERIEWIEPEEATRERREQARRVSAGVIGVGASLLALDFGAAAFLHQSLPSAFMGMCSTSITLGLLSLLQVGNTPISCVLDAEAIHTKREYVSCKHLWSRVRSFEISDYPALPGIRHLTMSSSSTARLAQLNFHAGQLDETELRAFIEARIAEQRARRLMRRVKM